MPSESARLSVNRYASKHDERFCETLQCQPVLRRSKALRALTGLVVVCTDPSSCIPSRDISLLSSCDMLSLFSSFRYPFRFSLAQGKSEIVVTCYIK